MAIPQMSDLDLVPAARLRAVAHIAGQAARRGPQASRAAGALDAFADLVGVDAISLFAWDPVARSHELVLGWGYVPDDFPAQGADDLLADDGYQLARRNRWPLRLSEVRRRRPALRRVLELSRFGEGMTACLFTADGRYTGVVNVNVEREQPFDDGLLATVALAVPSLAEIVDPTGSLQEAAALLPLGMPAVVLRPDGTVVALPGRASSPDLGAASPAIAAARRRAPAGPGTAEFLVAGANGRTTRVLVARPADPRAGQALLVAAAPAQVPLSRRELEVLTLVAEGATNPEIAARLIVSRHTVATHLAHILERLGLATRSAAAAHAVAHGLLLADADR